MKKKAVTFECDDPEKDRNESRRNKLMHRTNTCPLRQSLPQIISSISRTNWSNVELISSQLVAVAERYPGAFLQNVNQLTTTLISHVSIIFLSKFI